MSIKETIRAEIRQRIKKFGKLADAAWRNDDPYSAEINEHIISELQSLIVFTYTLPEQPVSVDLEEEIATWIPSHIKCEKDPHLRDVIIKWAGFVSRHFAEWGEKNAYKAIMKKADEVRDKRFDTDYEVKIEPAAGFDLGCVNVYHEGKLVGQYVEPKEEKKLPDGLEEAADAHIRRVADAAGHPGWDWTTQDIAEAFKAGVEWGATHLKR